MTWLIAIDESGNLGSDSRFFSMAAIVTRRVRSLSPVFKAIPRVREESKFYNSTESEIHSVLESFSKTDSCIFAVVVDKHDFKSKYYGLAGNRLYLAVLRDLMDAAFQYIGSHDANLFLDRNTFVSLDQLRSSAKEYAIKNHSNLKKCEKATSHQNKCIQIADYVVGTINSHFQNDDDRFYHLIEKKISFARKN